MKRILAFFCALSLLLSGFPAFVSSAAETDMAETGLIEVKAEPKEMFPDLRPNTKHLFGSIPLENDLPNGFVDYLQTHFGNCETQFSIAEFNIPYSRFNDLRFVIWYEMPELFHVYSLGCSYDPSTNTIADLAVRYQSYADTAAEYEACLNKMVSNAEYLLQGVKGNKNLTDVEKALILHDRLAIWTEYDLAGSEAMDPDSPIFDAYSALGEGLSVCQGYSMAYMYLLEQVGIESDLCTSDQLCHAWNIVYIDGVAYHVDVTWDDPINGASATFNDNYGRVLHNNFLLSSNGIWDSGHKAYDYSTAPRDTRYDNNSATTWWKKSNTAIQMIDNNLYYTDINYGNVRCADDGSVVYTYDEYGPYILSGVGKWLLCSNYKQVQVVDPYSGTGVAVYTPKNGYIEGMKYEKGKIWIQLNDDNGNARRESVDYVAPEMPEAPESADYTYTVSNGKATITGYKGAGGDITIPAKLGGYPVTAIQEQIFVCDNSLTSVVIPDTVTELGDELFVGCENLTAVTLSNNLKVIPFAAFSDCAKLTSVTIPDSVTRIEEQAFEGCGLTSVNISANVTYIGLTAFHGCDSLGGIWVDAANSSYSSNSNGVLFNKAKTKLLQAPRTLSGAYSIPNTVTLICASAFEHCEKMTDLTIPDSVITIGGDAIAGTGITSLTIPDSVTAIFYGGIADNKKLTTVYLGGGLTTIEEAVFYNCNSLTDVYYNGTEEQWNTIEISKYYNDPLFNAKIHFTEVHVHNYAKKVANPTCTAKGYTTYTCECGDTYVADYVNAKGHSYAAATCTKPKTCKVCKTTSGKALGHSYKSGSCTRCKYKPTGAKITTQPKNVAVSSGKTATVTVKASGTGLKYTWYYAKKGAKSYTKASSTTNSYSLKMSTSYNGTKVYCVVSDAYGNSVKSAVVTLYKGTPAKITTQPKSTTVANGKSGSITLKASGSSLKYQWYIKYKGASTFTKTGKSSKTYSFKMASKLDGAQVYCVVKDKYGIEVKSSTVTIKQAPLPKITTQPKSTKAFSGKTVKFTVKASGEGLKYQWYYAKKGSSKFKKLSAKSATYSVKVSSSVDGRKYYCLVTDKYGQTVKSSVVTLTMQRAAKILTQPKNVSVKNGKAAKVTIKAEGDGLKYTWYYLLAGETKYRKASATGNTFSVTMSAKYKNAKVYCAISDQYGNSVKSKTVTLKMK